MRGGTGRGTRKAIAQLVLILSEGLESECPRRKMGEASIRSNLHVIHLRIVHLE